MRNKVVKMWYDESVDLYSLGKQKICHIVSDIDLKNVDGLVTLTVNKKLTLYWSVDGGKVLFDKLKTTFPESIITIRKNLITCLSKPVKLNIIKDFLFKYLIKHNVEHFLISNGYVESELFICEIHSIKYGKLYVYNGRCDKNCIWGLHRSENIDILLSDTFITINDTDITDLKRLIVDYLYFVKYTHINDFITCNMISKYNRSLVDRLIEKVKDIRLLGDD